MSSLPQPLTPFERLMLEDARADYPMTFCLTFNVSGRVNREILKDAFTAVVNKFPLFKAVVKKRWLTAPSWMESHLQIDFRDEHVERNSQWIWSRWDLTHSPGIRVDVRTLDELTQVSVGFHHAIADGLGGFVFLSELWREYHRLCGADSKPKPSLVNRRERRGREQKVAGTDEGTSPTQNLTVPQVRVLPLSSILREVWRFLGSSPKPIPAHNPNKDRPSFCNPLVSILIEETQLRGLRLFASTHSVQVNDVCIAALFSTLNGQHANGNPTHRLTIPVNLREGQTHQYSTSNCMSYAFLQRRKSDCRSFIDLVQSVHKEVHEARTNGWCQLFLYALGIAQRIPMAVGIATRRSKCLSTAVLSTLGDTTRRMVGDLPRVNGKIQIGDAIIEHICGVPPVRPNTRIAIGSMIYNGKLSLSAIGCPRTLGEPGTREFLKRYTDELRSIADQALAMENLDDA